MGSLMAGWDSPVLGDDDKVRLMRNRSLTKEEVEAFRRQQQQRKPPAVDDGETMEKKNPLGSWPRRRSPASSSPLGRGGDKIDAGAGESPSKSRDWWTRSNWAFLNEPPQEEAAPGSTAHSYTPQFHVVTGNA